MGMSPFETRPDYPVETLEVPQGPCKHWRGILRIWPRLHIGEESREAPRNSHGDWPFLRPQERVPEVPVVTREHLCNSGKSRRFTPPGDVRPISAEAS